jgi:hypothetical protein
MTPVTGPLRALLDTSVTAEGCSLQDLTVLERSNDPFRVDTPARHRDASWLATTAADLGLGDRSIRLRGLHYACPEGTTGALPAYRRRPAQQLPRAACSVTSTDPEVTHLRRGLPSPGQVHAGHSSTMGG